MALFDIIDGIFQDLRNSTDFLKDFVTLATLAGLLLLLIYGFMFLHSLVQCFRLYFFSQYCCTGNLAKKYGRWAVISGATDGIGLAMAKHLAKGGHSIIVIGRNEEKLARTKTELEEEPNVGDVVTVKIDLSDSSAENYERIRDQIDPDHRDIGILINNAGTFASKFRRFNRFEMDSISSTVNINVLGVLYLTRMIMPGMLERGKGMVMNVSSVLGSIPAPYMSVYGPTKSFVDSFSRLLQIEYSSHPIDIINITPGPIMTKLFIATSKRQRTDFICPSPDDYAKSTLNAASTGIKSFAGTFTHEMMQKNSYFFETLGLLPMMFKINLKLFGKDAELSPVMKRKARPNQVSTSVS